MKSRSNANQLRRRTSGRGGSAQRFSPPPVRVALQPRPRLAFPTWPQVILAQAPAGYGKTAMLIQLWEALDEGVAKVWLSASAAHRAQGALLLDLVAGLEAAGVEAAAVVRDDPEQSGVALGELVSGGERAFRLVLDNYQDCATAETDSLVRAFLGALHGDACAAIGVRGRPNIGAGVLAARGDLQQIGAEALRFTDEETSAFLGSTLSPEAIAQLYVETEGWPAALQLAQGGHQVRHGEADPVGVCCGVFGDIGAYLDEETFHPLLAPLKQALVETALLEVLDSAAIDHVRGGQDGAAMLETLARSGALVSEAGGGLRKHPLLRRFLEARFALLAAERRSVLAARSAEIEAGRGALPLARTLIDRFATQLPRLSLLEDRPLSSVWAATGVIATTEELLRWDEACFEGAPRFTALRAIGLYGAGRVDEARAWGDVASEGLEARREHSELNGALAARHILVWEGIRAALFDDLGAERARLELGEEAQAIGADDGRVLLAHCAATLALRRGASTEAWAWSTAATSVKRAHTSERILGVLTRVVMALWEADFIGARAALTEADDLDRERRFDAARRTCAAWLNYERGRPWSSHDLADIGAAPALFGLSPELFVEAERLRAIARSRSHPATAMAELDEARALAATRGWRRAEAALDAVGLALSVRTGALDLGEARAAGVIAGGAQERPDSALALASWELATQRAPAARKRLASLLATQGLARRWRARALVLAARAAGGEGADADKLLMQFLSLQQEGASPASLFEDGDELWERLLAASPRILSDAAAQAVADFAVARSLYTGCAPLRPPTAQEAAMFGALRRSGARAEAARALDMSENTMKTHLGRVFRCWGVSDWRVAARIAELLGGTGLPA